MKSNVLGKRDLHRFQLEGMILRNRYYISLPVQGVSLSLRVGVQVSIGVKFIRPVPFLSDLRVHVVIVWFEVYIFENILKLHCYNIHEIKFSRYCLHTAITILHATVILSVENLIYVHLYISPFNKYYLNLYNITYM